MILLSEVFFSPLNFQKHVSCWQFWVVSQVVKNITLLEIWGLPLKISESCSLSCIVWAEVCQVLYQPLGFPEQ